MSLASACQDMNRRQISRKMSWFLVGTTPRNALPVKVFLIHHLEILEEGLSLTCLTGAVIGATADTHRVFLYSLPMVISGVLAT
jgi:hypothetical protein